MAKKQLVNGIRVYSQHSDDCPQHNDSSYLDCHCPKWMQWQERGKQYRQAAHTRSKTILIQAAEQKGSELEQLARGEVPATQPQQYRIDWAVQEWLRDRRKKNLGVTKHTLLGKRLVAWAHSRKISYLSQIRKNELNTWRNTWPYRTGDSSSLKVHWSILTTFFTFCVDLDLMSANPIPKGPTWKIRYKSREVQPFSEKQVVDIIAAVDKVPGWDAAMRHRVRTFILTMRHTGMAIQDTMTLSRKQLNNNFIHGNRTKTHVRFEVLIPAWLADELNSLISARPEYFFWIHDRKNEIPRTERMLYAWTHFLRKVFAQAGITDAHSHRFRHTFITEKLKVERLAPEVVADMCGLSPAMIRKTYEHWIPEGRNRLIEIQRQSWERQGLDRNGNPLPVN